MNKYVFVLLGAIVICIAGYALHPQISMLAQPSTGVSASFADMSFDWIPDPHLREPEFHTLCLGLCPSEEWQ